MFTVPEHKAPPFPAGGFIQSQRASTRRRRYCGDILVIIRTSENTASIFRPSAFTKGEIESPKKGCSREFSHRPKFRRRHLVAYVVNNLGIGNLSLPIFALPLPSEDLLKIYSG